jgi:hypothetical protein
MNRIGFEMKGRNPARRRKAVDRIATLTMVFKLGLEAQKHWRRLQGFELIPKVVTGVRFVDGEEQAEQAA